ncbi:glycosyltransferase family 2 protein [Profundibacterium mesophilum]|uniref:Glycosyl transferase family 2domain containing protein n=1 Tax=Profundibacterium mesophilum KAUST100406-0324 TaxID=1037889 RepID=A0A921TDI3_9RHOB|nr:glycosyltransferase family 2 protein [Profundibacterium mesophilum]KAF0676381.1 Glycosyl transferase family 2domain containing protein [Profundibacterium mesophilum KAUST100406-0324]
MAPDGPLRALSAPLPLPPIGPGAAFRLRWKRRRLLWRAFRARRALHPRTDRTALIRPGAILCFSVMRNEALRLPYFLAHYRALGVTHFLLVDNGSDDGTDRMLAAEPDVSLWTCTRGYRDARFGLDWIGWLLLRHGHGHWCLTVDADELLVYPGAPERDLEALIGDLEAEGRGAFGAVMLDLYPHGPLDAQTYRPGDDPTRILRGFDAGPWRAERQAPLGNLWLRGGTRARAFFAGRPSRAPTLNKIPLLRWSRRYAYVNSTHSLLPRRLNAAYDGPGDPRPCGVLLHSKFLPDAPSRARTEKARGEHFHDPAAFAAYYDAVARGGTLWHEGSLVYEGPAQLEALGLMSRGAAGAFGETGPSPRGRKGAPGGGPRAER